MTQAESPLAGLRTRRKQLRSFFLQRGCQQAHLDGHSGVGTAAFDEDSKAVGLEGQCPTMLYHAHSAEHVQNSQGVPSVLRDLKGTTH